MEVAVGALGLVVGMTVSITGSRRLIWAARRKGFRGPPVYLGGSALGIVAAGTTGVALAQAPPGHAVLIAGSVAAATAIGLYALGAAVVRLLPWRPGRPGLRRTRVPYSAIAWILGATAVAVGVAAPFADPQLQLIRLVGPLLGIAGLSAALARRARAPQAEQADELVADGSTVLFLRGFTDDTRTFSVSDTRRARRGLRRLLAVVFVDTRADYPTAERYLGPAITELVGPLVGLGNPVDSLPPDTTMRRYYAPDAQWRAEIARLVPRVRAVLVVLSASTAALAWELGHIRDVGAQDRMFLVRPPDASTSWSARLRRRFDDRRLGSAAAPWTQLVDDLDGLGYALPAVDPGPGTVLGFDDAGRAQVLTTGATSARQYAEALAARLGGDPVRQTGAP